MFVKLAALFGLTVRRAVMYNAIIEKEDAQEEIGVHNDIGRKIMDWMKWVCIIGWVYVVIDLIGEIAVISDAGKTWLQANYGTDSGFMAVLQALINAALAAAGIYVGSWVLYGFGQLVDDVHAMRGKNSAAPVQQPAEHAVAAPSAVHKEEQQLPAHVQENTPLNDSMPKSMPANTNRREDMQQKSDWKCSCGRINHHFVIGCACGKRKSEIVVEDNQA